MKAPHYLLLLLPIAYAGRQASNADGPIKLATPCISYQANVGQQKVALYWRDNRGQRFGSIQNLKTWLASQHQTLVFAMNGGMYKPDNSPLGLYMEAQRVLMPLDTARGSGNFYLKPNGVFYITTANKPAICPTQSFRNKGDVKYATQSGPLLVLDGQINSAFTASSANINIRNGVGILPNGHVLFAMSKQAINFYDFANYFKARGCQRALYLDGLVSRTYLPAQNWVQTDGDFGVIIGVTKSAD